MSYRSRGRLWVSDKEGNLVLLDRHRHQALSTPSTETGGWEWHGFHTVTENGDLIYIDRSTTNNIIKKRTQNDIITTFTTTGDWVPISIHSSRSNGDVLVGMVKNNEARVTRYTSDGEENHITLERGSYPHYITENDMNNVYISDFRLNTLVVVNTSGEHIFSYTFEEGIKPYGLFAYRTNAIFVCCVPRNPNGNLPPLLKLLTHHNTIETTPLYPIQQDLQSPSALCWTANNELYVGESNTNIIKIYQVHRKYCAYQFRPSTLANMFAQS